MAKGLWVVLNVDNVDKSIEFYKALGFKAGRETSGPLSYGYVNNASPDAGFVLWNKHEVAPGQADDTRAWVSGELGKGVLLSVGVPNVRRVWEKAQAARVTIDQPYREQEWGGHEFTFVDPDGYVVNVSDRFPGESARKAPKRPARKAAKRAVATRTPAKAKRGGAAKGKRKGK